MNILARLLIGIPLLLFLGWLWILVFSVFVAVVNLPALGLARLLRKLFGIDGQWDFGVTASMTISELAKALVTCAFWVSILWYAFIYPYGSAVSEISMATAVGLTLILWMPATFLLGLFRAHE